MISAIVAVDENNGIGFNGQLLEKIPEDLKRFKELTIDNIIIMGRKTYDSLPVKPLPNRTTIVVTSTPQEEINTENAQVLFYSMSEVKDWLTKTAYDVYICGGESVYYELLPFCEKIYLTKIHKKYLNVDKYFPNVYQDKNKWWGAPYQKTKQYKDISYTFWLFQRLN